jgi:dTDP-4-amino-4,6-dideoxygalactose transaminase
MIAAHSRIPELQAAGLSLSLSHLSSESQKKARVAYWYTQAIQNAKLEPHIRILSTHPKSTPARHLFVIEAHNRDALQAYLKTAHIPTLIHYPTPIHLVKAFKSLQKKRGDFPISEHLSKRIISLPYHAHLSKTQVSYIIEKIRRFYETRRP